MIVRVRSAIVCDDVRTEDNGKTILIGVYGKDISVGQKPAFVNLTLQCAFDVDADLNPVEYRVRGKTSRTQQIDLKAEGGYCTLTAPLSVAMLEDRVITVDIRNVGGDWIECGVWRFRFTEDAEAAPDHIARYVESAAQHLHAAADNEAQA